MLENDDMRAVFFNPLDFGQEVTVTPAGAEPLTFIAIYDAHPVAPRAERGAQVGFEGGMQNTGNSPQIRCRTVDIPGVKAGRATATVTNAPGKEFNVWDVKHDGTGLSMLILKAA